MRGLHIPELMPDEFILGYLGRIASVNGIMGETAIRSSLKDWYLQQPGTNSKVTLLEQLSFASKIDSHQFACHHTLIPVYRAVASHLHENKHGDPHDFGLLSAHAPRLMRDDVQICQECVKEDLDYLGFSFWRRSHQLPGIDWCQKHAVGLHSLKGKSHFFMQPSLALNYAQGSFYRQGEIDSNAVIKRYEELLNNVLDFPKPISPLNIAKLIANKAKQFGLRLSISGEKAVLSDKAVQLLPASWAKKHYPLLAKKAPGQYLYEYDGVISKGGKARSSTSYILATAVLSETSEEGLQLWWTAVETPRRETKKQVCRTEIPVRRIKAAYVSTNGNIARMASELESEYEHLLQITRSLGLPSLVIYSAPTLTALADFYEKKASLKEIFLRPSLVSDHLDYLLRSFNPIHFQLIRKIAWNKQCQGKILLEGP